MRRILRYFVFLITIVSSFFVINSKSEADELKHDYNVILEENEDNNSFVLKNKDDEIIYNTIVSTKIDKNLLEGESEDLVNLWYIPKNEFIEENGLSKDKNFNKNKENEKAYKVNSTEKFEFKLSDKAEYVKEDHEYFEDYYRIIQTYKLNNSEYEVEHRILFPSYFEKKREEYLNRINPDLVLKFINRQDVSGFDKKAQKVNKKSIKKDKKISKNKEEKKDNSKNLDQSKEKTEEGNQENSDKGDSSGNDGDESLDNGSDDPNKKIIYSGSLKDKDGNALANSEVSITDNNGNTIKVKTDEDGYFSVKLDQNSTYKLTSGVKKGTLQTKGVDKLDLKSEDFIFNAGKIVNNKYGFVNFQPSVAYLNQNYQRYEVLKDYVFLEANEFDYKEGDIVVLPSIDGHKYGKVLKIKNISRENNYLKINYETPYFMETFRKVKMDTGEDGIDISEFSIVNNNNYLYSKKKKEPKVMLYSAERLNKEFEKYLNFNIKTKLNRETSSDDGVSYGGEFLTSFTKDDEEDLFLGFGLKIGKDTQSFTVLNQEGRSLTLDKFKFQDIEKHGEKLLKSVASQTKKNKEYKDTDISLENEIDFKIYGNLGLIIDYDIERLWDIKIDFRK